MQGHAGADERDVCGTGSERGARLGVSEQRRGQVPGQNQVWYECIVYTLQIERGAVGERVCTERTGQRVSSQCA